MSGPNVKLDVGQSIPAGYIIGRLNGGTGPAGLISIASLAQQLAPQPAVPGSGGGGGGGVTVSAGSGITVTGGPAYIVSLTSPVTVAHGGTGQTSYTDGQLLIGDSSTSGLDVATLTAGAAISVTNGHGSITITNTGVTSLTAGTAISVSAATGSITVSGAYVAGGGISITGATIANTGVTSLAAANNLHVSASTGAVTVGTAGVDPPGADQDAVTWASIEGIQWKRTANVATTGALPTCTYSNGTGGSGATLTASANGTLTVDGVAVNLLGGSLLVKNQASAFQNGLYTCTQVGDASHPFILTRAPWNDDVVGTTGYTQAVTSGDMVAILQGTANAKSIWMQTGLGSGAGGVIVPGTDSLAYTQIASAAVTAKASSSGVVSNALWGPIMSAVPTGSGIGFTTWLGQTSGGSTASISDGATGHSIIVPARSANDNWAFRYMAAPGSTPYSFSALITLSSAATTNIINGVAIGWTDGTKLEVIRLLDNNNAMQLWHTDYTNVTTFNLNNPAVAAFPHTLPVWVQIRDDGTTVYFQVSGDGVNWKPLFSNLKSVGFLGSSGYSNICFGVAANFDTVGTILSWKQGV